MQTESENLTQTLFKELIQERRSERRWKNIRFFLGLALIILVFFVIFSESSPNNLSEGEGKDYVAFIRLQGMIGPDDDFSAQNVVPLLTDAFKDTDAKGVILDINSGGGTPVQASIIHDAIIQLKKKYHKKIVVVGEDMLASGAYFISVAADKIYVNPNSITGSIGVIMKGFGFADLLKKVGVERRVYASGTEKDRLDPFLPQNAADIEKIDQLIGEIHDNFVKVVLEGRKGRLQADPKILFTGDFWTGESALKLGLIDGLGNLQDVMQTEFEVSRYKDFSQSQSVVKALMGQVGASMKMMVNGLSVLPSM
jgi:protease-4